jgi:predicted transcriptional regulator
MLRNRILVLTSGPIFAVAGVVGCAEIEKATPEDATKLAELRADLEQDNALVEYQKVRKKELELKGEDPDQLDNAELLRPEPRFTEFWKRSREAKFEAAKEHYKTLAADIVRNCTDMAKAGRPAEEVDKCVRKTPEAKYDPGKAAALGALVVLLGVGTIGLYRTLRRRNDPVALAANKLGLAATQSPTSTTLQGEYKGYQIKVESSPPEAGEDDRYVRCLVLSKVDPHAVVRFGPVAPPTGLDLPDLDAPEVHDARLPEGYKLRLSGNASAEPLLAGDIGFQLRAFDPIDLRVHDGMLGLTIWQMPPTTEKVTEFLDVAVTVAKLYSV